MSFTVGWQTCNITAIIYWPQPLLSRTTLSYLLLSVRSWHPVATIGITPNALPAQNSTTQTPIDEPSGYDKRGILGPLSHVTHIHPEITPVALSCRSCTQVINPLAQSHRARWRQYHRGLWGRSWGRG